MAGVTKHALERSEGNPRPFRCRSENRSYGFFAKFTLEQSEGIRMTDTVRR